MSIMFPTIFALGVKELGDQTKLGSSFIIMAIVGGALIPPVMGLIADRVSLQTAVLVPALCFLVVSWFGWRGYRIQTKG
jgi:FHS family L-fucose permease-like MFS transporter